MKNHNDPIGNQTRSLPDCSAEPKPTASPRIPKLETGQTVTSLSSDFSLAISVAKKILKDRVNILDHRPLQITNLMHKSFIFQQYVCYTTLLNMFRTALCSSSGGPIVSPQPLVSSPSVNSRTECRLRADCSPLSSCILYGCLQRVTIPEAVVIQLVLLRMSSVLLETC